MTCIVGKVDKREKRVYIGADSAGVAGLDITIRKDEKVFKNGDFLIGCTSSFRMIQILRYSFTPPEIGEKEIYEYMCTDFVDEIRNVFKDKGYLQKYKDGDDKGGQFLVGYKDRLFKVENDFQVGEARRGYDAVGSGEPFALGALYKGSGSIRFALEAAAFFNAGVSAPFIILNT